MSIKDNLLEIKSELPENVTLVAVSKTKPVSELMEAYEAGQRIFGENKIQEMADKFELMPKDIKWHMIGHVQTNKVKFMAPFVSLVHGVDSLKLLEEIDKQAQKINRTIDCLLQIHIAEEETKFGLNEAELLEILQSETFKNLKNIKVKGLMGMATFTDDQQQIKKEFTVLKQLFDKVNSLSMISAPFGSASGFHPLSIISLGMSGDYKIAIDCGSTMVRIGSSIFGGRI